MKRFNAQWIMFAGVVGFGIAAIVSSNAGCGSSGGTAGSGGTTGSAGTGGTGAGGHAGGTGGALVLRLDDSFPTDKQGWSLSTYVDTNYLNLGAASDPDSGVSLDGGMVPTLDFNASDGNPDPGSLSLTVTFSGFKQYVDPNVNLPTPVDLTNRIVHARIRLVSGTFPAGGVQFHVSSGLTAPNSYVYVSAPFVNASSLTVGNWITINLDTSTVTPTDGRVFDPSQIVQVGIQFTTGDPYEGGTVSFGQAVFEIDTVQG
jgi:hypothetical protein